MSKKKYIVHDLRQLNVIEWVRDNKANDTMVLEALFNPWNLEEFYNGSGRLMDSISNYSFFDRRMNSVSREFIRDMLADCHTFYNDREV